MSQYGIRLSREANSMSWDEFKDLLCGLGADTALGRIVAIRAEDDKDRLKHFSKEQHRIRNKWRQKQAKNVTPTELNSFLDSMKDAFISMTGGVQN